MRVRRIGCAKKVFGAGGLVLLMGGCQYLPEQGGLGTEPEAPQAAGCRGGEPTFENEACLLPNWVAYGLASQRGDSEWRRQALNELDAAHDRSEAERELARAVALSWGSEREWRQAAELYQEHTHAAPADLQPLLLYWRNELEGRRALAGRSAEALAQVSTLQRQNAELSEKLEALTAIEQNMNLRQQSP
ncbi:hypothetical protein HOP62_11255 [Halomonas sp. MCCC 1A17488]|uniref:hypothetical protein n=1 Tax=unclassified Halomonas TaxID=2609666 RepID=UPI0018D20848|nr:MULTISPECIES: hypothetical protein [unclassified Halomonas]MCE8016646.1 hypothetical protein [Halomonas sp. MCCC 1A17488]MCG3239979.1 hypothetical protein [Halomonas sp. MCCC 1A17488]QPP50131.1 hypothetical protein I4484_03115 [Halomonas sp. SS10-MC5]